MIIQRIVFNLIFIVYQNQILKDNLLGGRHEVRQPLYNWEAFTIVYYREIEIYVRELQCLQTGFLALELLGRHLQIRNCWLEWETLDVILIKTKNLIIYLVSVYFQGPSKYSLHIEIVMFSLLLSYLLKSTEIILHPKWRKFCQYIFCKIQA